MKKKMMIILCCMTLPLVGCDSESQAEIVLQVEPISLEESGQTGEKQQISDADITNPEVGAVTAYYSDGSEVLLTENTDGTYLSGDGVKYYLDDDGVYHAEGYDDMYVSAPQGSNDNSADEISIDQALEAIKRYCCANNPELEGMLNSGDSSAYFEASTSDADEIVVLYRSYTAAQIRYYINPTSGDVYVTELVPGIIDNEQKTDETFNIKDYMNQ